MDKANIGSQAPLARQHRLHLHGTGSVERAQELLQLTSTLARADTLETLLRCFLDAALELLDSECGHVQLLDESSRNLTLVAHVGFDRASHVVLPAAATAILKLTRRVLVDDLDGNQHALELGCSPVAAHLRAAQVTPIRTWEGRCIGALTTYSELPYDSHADALHMLDELSTHAVGVLQTLQRYEALEAIVRGKDDFLATVAHELRNSLAPVRTSIEILKMARLTEPVQIRARGILDGRLGTMERLVDDLMDASRIARDKLSLRTERVSLLAIVRNAIETVSASLEQRRHDLIIDLPAEQVFVDGDSVRLVQVFVNLLDNAAKYTPARGRIEVRVVLDGTDVRVSLRDTGIGIAADALPRLFDLFAQDPRGHGHRSGGLGIGLALVQGIVRMHGGSVEAASPGIGRGSTFTVKLPLAASTAEQSPGGSDSFPLPSGSNLFSLRVIVADSNLDSASTLAGLLRSHGHQARVANDGLRAVEITREFDPDLVFLDVSLPPFDAVDVAERIRQLPLTRRPEIIELTSDVTRGAAPRELAAGISECMPKAQSYSSMDQIVASIASKVNSMGEISSGFLITQLELSLTMLSATEKVGDPLTRAQAVQRAHLAYERGVNLLNELSSEPEKQAGVRERLDLLEKKLRAGGEIP